MISSPKYTWKVMNNFPLVKLEKTFTIADFERPISLRHVNKIVLAMVNNNFFDNVIRVILKRNGQFEIIDGQHRIEALGILRDKHDVTKYDIVLHIFPESGSRRIYRSINLSKALNLQDHLRALDNGRSQFFIRLRPYYVHYNDGSKPKFEMILNALHYSKNGSPRAVRPLLLDRMFKSITEGDINTILEFSRVFTKIEPFIPKTAQHLYRFGIYRNMFRVGYENGFDENFWDAFISECKNDRVIKELQSEKSAEGIKRIYSYMVDQMGERLKWDLKKIDRTGSQARLVLNQGNSTPLINYQ